MATIESIATQRNNEHGRPVLYRFREEEDIYKHTHYVMLGNQTEAPLFASARGFVSSKDDPRLVAEEIIAVQKIHKKTTGIRIRGEKITVSKKELGNNPIKEIKSIAEGFCDYYMGLGHQIAYGIYDVRHTYEVRYAINTVNYADGGKYRHNSHDIQQQEESCLATIIADATGRTIPGESKFDFEALEYTP